jgi:hypothetical protein
VLAFITRLVPYTLPGDPVRLRNRSTLLIGASLLLLACSGDGTTAPGTNPNNSLNAALAQFSQPAFVSAMTAAGAPALASSSGAPTGCTYTASSRSFVCATISSSSFAISRSYMLFDAGGVTQSSFDPATTASVRMMSTVKGTVSTSGIGPGSITLDEADDMTVSGLLGSARVMNGTSKSATTVVTTVNGTSQTINTSVGTTLSKLTMPATATSYPAAGTIVSDLSTTVSGISTHMVMTLTFNGTKTVHIVMAIDGFSQSCTMDMDNPASTTCS